MAVGIVLPQVTTAFHATALHSAQQVVEDAGYQVLVVATERRRGASATGCAACARTGWTACSSPPTAASRTWACRRCSSTTAPAGAGAVAYENVGGTACSWTIWRGIHGHRRIAYFGMPETVGAGGAAGRGARAPRRVPGRGRATRARVPAESVRLRPSALRRRRARAPPSSSPLPAADGGGHGRRPARPRRPPRARDGGRRVPGDVALVCSTAGVRRCARPADDLARSPRSRDRPAGGRMLLAALDDPEAGDGPSCGSRWRSARAPRAAARVNDVCRWKPSLALQSFATRAVRCGKSVSACSGWAGWAACTRRPTADAGALPGARRAAAARRGRRRQRAAARARRAGRLRAHDGRLARRARGPGGRGGQRHRAERDAPRARGRGRGGRQARVGGEAGRPRVEETQAVAEAVRRAGVRQRGRVLLPLRAGGRARPRADRGGRDRRGQPLPRHVPRRLRQPAGRGGVVAVRPRARPARARSAT